MSILKREISDLNDVVMIEENLASMDKDQAFENLTLVKNYIDSIKNPEDKIKSFEFFANDSFVRDIIKDDPKNYDTNFNEFYNKSKQSNESLLLTAAAISLAGYAVSACWEMYKGSYGHMSGVLNKSLTSPLTKDLNAVSTANWAVLKYNDTLELLKAFDILFGLLEKAAKDFKKFDKQLVVTELGKAGLKLDQSIVDSPHTSNWLKAALAKIGIAVGGHLVVGCIALALLFTVGFPISMIAFHIGGFLKAVVGWSVFLKIGMDGTNSTSATIGNKGWTEDKIKNISKQILDRMNKVENITSYQKTIESQVTPENKYMLETVKQLSKATGWILRNIAWSHTKLIARIM